MRNGLLILCVALLLPGCCLWRVGRIERKLDDQSTKLDMVVADVQRLDNTTRDLADQIKKMRDENAGNQTTTPAKVNGSAVKPAPAQVPTTTPATAKRTRHTTRDLFVIGLAVALLAGAAGLANYLKNKKTTDDTTDAPTGSPKEPTT